MNGRNRSDQDEYRDEDSEDAQPPSTPNTVEINTRGRPRRAAAVKADLMRPVKPTRRRRARSDSEDEAESDEPFFLNCEICKKSGWNEVRTLSRPCFDETNRPSRTMDSILSRA